MTRLNFASVNLTLVVPFAALLSGGCSAAAAADDASGASLTGSGSETAAFAQGLAVAPPLGSVERFSILGSSTVTCANSSTVEGDVGVSPGIAITGFDASCKVSGELHAKDAVADAAHEDLSSVFDQLASASCDTDLTGVDLGGLTLSPGVYCFDTTAGITGTLTLDGGGDASAAWIFQVGSALTTATGSSVAMAGASDACNVFWQVGSSATLGTNSALAGNLLASASVTLTSGSRVFGRALALNAAVTSDNNDVSGCAR